ncbi:ABC transporter substrate-binding protein [Cryptosporangium aurantiacum]|uniref:ABC-type branched-chain amino acid transport system, substrate-binding protein n=1 Tax=Cryptosporangium aurantiacum TaxID=134849 RepID=A0A1M7KFM0_9ACTN|nr:ABC transporter substrate-binding protein [Cryptosporangium aurantiacum]SHM64109.1 ABC-type branched-chain amino acid transport system, substrate-binding protein [Cryptosporangium aurantiacum]
MRGRGIAAIGAACAVALVVAACGDGGGSSTPGDTVKVGILTSLSGPNSAAFKGTVSGAEARLAAYEEDGGKCADKKFETVKADDQSNAQGALTASQKLIQQDKVYTVLAVSSFFYGATPYLTTAAKGTPIIGGGFDGAKEWQNTKNNLFPAIPVPNYSKTYTTAGDYLKSVGGTKVAGVAYESPSSQQGLEASLRSAEQAGLKRGYVNTTVPFGSTDVGAIVLGIIQSKSDVVQFGINPDTSFAIVAGLKQAGYTPKAVVSATGYGNDLLESAPAVQAGQGVTFTTGWAPNELKNEGTERMSKALKDHAGSKSGIPGFAQTMGWMTADIFLHGLEVAGCDADQAKFISDLRADKTWDADGLYPSPRDFTTIEADEQCQYFLKLEGSAFVPEPKASPLCGKVVSG